MDIKFISINVIQYLNPHIIELDPRIRISQLSTFFSANGGGQGRSAHLFNESLVAVKGLVEIVVTAGLLGHRSAICVNCNYGQLNI